MELTVQEALLKGIEAHKEGKLQDAERIYRAILEVEPNHPDANHNLGVLAVGVGKSEESLPFFKKALEANFNQPQFWVSYINTLIQTHQIEEAKQALIQAKEYGVKTEALGQLTAQIYKEQPTDNESGVGTRNPENLDSLLAAALEHHKAGDLHQAEALYERVLNQNPNHFDALQFAATLALQCNNYLKADSLFEKALTISNRSEILFNNYGIVLNHLKRHDEALKNIERALRLNPEYPEALYNHGFTLHQLGCYEAATESYDRAVKFRPGYKEAMNNSGNALLALSRYEEALERYRAATDIDPNYDEAYYNKGLALHNLGRLQEALVSYERAIKINSNYVEALNNYGSILYLMGNYDQAVEFLQKAIIINPNYIEAYENLGVIYKKTSRYNDAIQIYKKAIKLHSKSKEFYCWLGDIFQETKKYQDALHSYEKALDIRPDYIEALNGCGNTLGRLGRFEEALHFYERAIGLHTTYAEVHNNYGVTAAKLGYFKKAIESYDNALRLKPDYAEAFNNRGLAYYEIRNFDKAVEDYNAAIQLKPDYAEAFNNRGNTLGEILRFTDALDSYEEALRLKPDYAEAFNNRGVIYHGIGQLKEAILNYERAIHLKPDYADAFYNKGNALLENRRFDEAVQSYEQVLSLRPIYPCIEGDIVFLKNRMCDWRDLKEKQSRINSYLKSDPPLSSPFPILSISDEPSHPLRAAHSWIKFKNLDDHFPDISIKGRKKDKLRIAYFSADFRQHPIAQLAVQLFELHDRKNFEVFGFSFGPTSEDGYRQRIINSFDRFFDVDRDSDPEVRDLCRKFEVDISVDLMGFTRGNRLGLFSKRCSPIQINWLGYPGTMAAPFIDYLIADPTLITQDDLDYYTEKVIWLPEMYQMNDRKRAISEKPMSRLEHGLPENCFVFCCFNNSYKILPETFEIWMRVLKRVPGSVLWVLKDNPVAAKNLKSEVESRGVDPKRLVFADRFSLDEHLARHRLADLFIDTWPYNAHTTASDALWAGLPLVTRSGRSFASRVAGSLLKAVGLEELITYTNEAYEELIVSLALQPDRLRVIREKLAKNRLTYPLFDSERFTRHIEKAYRQVMERHWRGDKPDHLRIEVI